MYLLYGGPNGQLRSTQIENPLQRLVTFWLSWVEIAVPSCESQVLRRFSEIDDLVMLF